MTKTVSITRLQTALNDSESQAGGVDQSMLEKPFLKTDSDCLITKVFEDMSSELLEDLSDEEEETVHNIMSTVKYFCKINDIRKKNIARQVKDEAADHCENLQALLQEEINGEKGRMFEVGSVYEKRVRETLRIMEEKFKMITDEENKSLEEILSFCKADVNKLVEIATKRKEEEIKETNAIASVYSNVVNCLSQVFCALIISIFLLWLFTAGNVLI